MSLFGDVEKKSDDQRKLEDIIKQIKGVVSSNVVLGSDGKIQEIHILADSSKQPKQIVRDVESALMAELGFEIDHKKVSVAQIKGNGSKGRNGRIQIDKVEISGSKNWLVSKVALRIGEKVIEGASEGPNTGESRYKLLAAATIKAVEGAFEQKLRLVVEDFAWHPMAQFEVGAVVLSCVTDNDIERMVGACLSTHSKDVAAVKAVLDALNRRLEVI
ncbi:MAG: hypothetical protein AB1420_05170 [Bacillota bacterium]